MIANGQLAVQRFGRYTLIGVSTFLLDLALLWVFIEWVGIHYLTATAIAFLLASALNYFISRRYAFKMTRRDHLRGLLFFLCLASTAVVIITFSMWVLTTYTDIPVYVTRVLIAGMVGFCNYLANLYLNFKVSNVPLSTPKSGSDLA
jgi:putative flippase GtrA